MLLMAGAILLYALISRKAPALFRALFNLQTPGDSASLGSPPIAPAVA
jgi:hypothetical protein